MPTVDRLVELAPDVREAILAPLDAFTRQRGYAWSPTPLSLVLREDERIVGGLIGETQWGWLRIDILAVVEGLRGGGWGRKLVEEAERIAVEAGCRGAGVDTYSFQSPGFYQKLGYAVFGVLPDYPTGQTRYFLSKRLKEGAALPGPV